METLAIVISNPGELAVRRLGVVAMGPGDVLVETEWSAISTGTEKLLWTGRMPAFPGLGYPLVPGYETVGRVVDSGADARHLVGQRVFVPGASCFEGARGLFGGSASRLVVAGARVLPVGDLQMEAVLLALAATAQRAVAGGVPELIVGHGVLGRLVARLAVAAGGSPTVWEINPVRADGAQGYSVVHPEADSRRDYRVITDVSGDSNLLDGLFGRLSRGGEICLAGFYDQRLSFGFSEAFRAEARIRVSAEFRPEDLAAVSAHVHAGRLSLDGLVSHVRPAAHATEAYPQAFTDPDCLKMVLDWREVA